MKRLYFAALALAAVLPAAAQDTYENARLLGNDLNGTARYVGMGGAMEALGADLSTISTNPAGIGMFRHNVASLSFGGVSQQDAQKFDELGKTNLSFDQAGFVYSMRSGRRSFLNFAFNYHKSKNFDQLLSASSRLNAASLNKLTYIKAQLGDERNGGFDPALDNDGFLMGYANATSNERAYTFNQLDDLMSNVANLNYDDRGNAQLQFADADIYSFDKLHRGYIGEYDFNLSGNSDDRFYWGVTVGLHDVRYKGYSEYTEGLTAANGQDLGYLTLSDEREITGTGADFKFGVIFRPVEYSPFRIGLSVATPTWYDLTSTNYTCLNNYSQLGDREWGAASEAVDFRFSTPWKFGLSAGHTIDNCVAIGASYEYASYGSSDTRIIAGYDDFGYQDSYSDKVMNGLTETALKGVSTLKLGVEYKVDPALAVRFGYNYVSPMYNETAVRNTMLPSENGTYNSTADYTNWKATNRITCGLGYRVDDFNIDLAYQYSNTKGDFYPFQPNASFAYADGTRETNVCPATEVSNKRHQVLLTLGYTF